MDPDSLILVSCSQAKTSAKGSIPAGERYDGPTFRLIRKFLREAKNSFEPKIYIISAKFGFIPFDAPIPYYDQKMDLCRAYRLRTENTSKIVQACKKNRIKKVIICVSQIYLSSIDTEFLEKENLVVEVAKGPPGKRLAFLYKAVYGHERPKDKISDQKVTGKAFLKGFSIELSTPDIFAKIEEFLKDSGGDEDNFLYWYVPYRNKKIAPKWLVSNLTGLHVSCFSSDESRRVLRQLGVPVEKVDRANGRSVSPIT